MKIGMGVSFSNGQDWDRFLAVERHEQPPSWPEIPDIQTFNENLDLCLQAEPLGFDSVFVSEHHFTPYSMCSNPLQLMSYLAAKTEHIDLGTMVVVLPWHHPVRVAEAATMTQAFMGSSRDLILGVGRGAARREFAGFGLDMGESRQRFRESVDILKLALTNPRFSYDGTHYQIPETELRPHLRDSRIVDNMYGVWGSSESVPIIAELGLKPFIIPQKPVAQFEQELSVFQDARAAAGLAPANPMFAVWMFCAESEEEAREDAQKYLLSYAGQPVRHYELGGAHFAGVKGYEHYAAGGRASAISADDLRKGQGQVVIDTSIWGTPEQCYEKIKALKQNKNTDHLILAARYGDMAPQVAQKSLELFAREVLPEARKL